MSTSAEAITRKEILFESFDAGCAVEDAAERSGYTVNTAKVYLSQSGRLLTAVCGICEVGKVRVGLSWLCVKCDEDFVNSGAEAAASLDRGVFQAWCTKWASLSGRSQNAIITMLRRRGHVFEEYCATEGCDSLTRHVSKWCADCITDSEGFINSYSMRTDLRAELNLLSSGLCPMCGRAFGAGSVEHISCRSWRKVSPNNERNMTLICSTCNYTNASWDDRCERGRSMRGVPFVSLTWPDAFARTEQALVNIGRGSSEEDGESILAELEAVGLMERPEDHGEPKRGERCWNAKLTDEIVIELREMRKAGAHPDDLARLVGMAPSALRKVLIGLTWSHVPNALRPPGVAKGERAGGSVLTEQIVIEARRLYVEREPEGGTVTDLIDILGLDITMGGLYNALTGITWKHVPGAIKLRGRGAHKRVAS